MQNTLQCVGHCSVSVSLEREERIMLLAAGKA